jgi:hypothetical protein
MKGMKPLAGQACAELAQWGRPWCSYRTLLGCGERKAAPQKKISPSPLVMLVRKASCVAVSTPHPWRTEGAGLGEVARHALLALVSALQVFLESGVGRCRSGRRAGARTWIGH